jgi:large subunit ribosomal protein L10
MANVAEYKKKIVQDMTQLMKEYSIVGMVNMEDMPAPQLQAMRSELRGKVDLFMTKKRFMRLAIENLKSEKKNIENLENYFEGMPALLFTNENPFKLSKILKKSKTKAPAKAGQIAPTDIVVNKGPTPFAPGPVISELSEAGLKVGVEDGKVAIKEDTVVAKKGEKIKPKVAEILARLDIKPMEVGLGLVAAYEDGIIYERGILDVDEKQYADNVNLAATQALNLSFNITYITKDNVQLLIGKAFNDSKALGIEQNILDKGIIDELLGKAERSMLGLKDSANIETQEVKEEKPETQEQPKEEPKQEVPDQKPQEHTEVKKEQPKPEEKKPEVPTQEKVLEEEKNIIEEEKKLEEQKPKEAPVEQLSSESKKGLEKSDAFQKEVQEAVKQEEEKKLEKERIEKEKQLEKIEEQKEKPKQDVDQKVNKMVENTKKFMEGKEETAADILEDVKKEEPKQEIPKQTPPKEVPSAHDLKKEQEEVKGEDKEGDQEHKEVEDLTKELLKKGTLRKDK